MLPYTSGEVCDELEVATALNDVESIACTSGEAAEAASAELVEEAILVKEAAFVVEAALVDETALAN
jgi:hypothetical protein